jgi:hypothetical protein
MQTINIPTADNLTFQISFVQIPLPRAKSVVQMPHPNAQYPCNTPSEDSLKSKTNTV